jgi:peptidoglycan/LPS O-acetylase OafA/YrhL
MENRSTTLALSGTDRHQFCIPERRLSGSIAKIGTYSYSIYLTHFFYVFWMGQVFFSLFQTKNFYIAAVAGLGCFLFAAVLASFSYKYIELPFLQLRRKYVADNTSALTTALTPGRKLLTP